MKITEKIVARLPMIKNIIICALAITCALLTVRLWFGNLLIQGLFPGEPVVAASPAHQRMAGEMVGSARMTVSFGAEGYEVVYSNLPAHEAWRISMRALSALIDEGSFLRSAEISHLDRGWLIDVASQSYITVEYNFAMPTGFFREQFGQRPGFLSSVFSSFETLIIRPGWDGVDFYFISNESGMAHVFTLDNAVIFDELREYLAQEPEPAHDLDFVVHTRNPIGEQMLHGTVRPFVLFFFPNPAVASDGVTVNGVYTYTDNARVVKFYPNNVVEYNAMMATSPSGTVSLASSLLAALDMLDRDRASMVSLGNPMNDVFLVGHSVGPEVGQWNFYFDYILGGRPMELDDDVEILNHAVEIRVINNAVVQYKRLMLNFYEGLRP